MNKDFKPTYEKDLIGEIKRCIKKAFINMRREYKITSDKKLTFKMKRDIKKIINNAINNRSYVSEEIQHEFLDKHPNCNVKATVVNKASKTYTSIYSIELGVNALKSFENQEREKKISSK